MHLINCLSPVTIRHRYTKEKISVPCGKCDYCRFVKNQSWVTRLQAEAAFHPYVFFITLKYAPSSVPTATYDGLRGQFYMDESQRDSGLFSALQDAVLDDKTWFYINERCKSLGNNSFYCVSKRDVQNFMKRLRINIARHKSIKHDGKDKISYYIVSEYGETTYRPHYHGIIFCDSYDVARNFDELLHKSWQYGNYTYRYSTGKDIAYTAAYLSYSARDILIYQLPLFRTFALCSKNKPIGSSAVKSSQVRKLLSGTVFELDIPNQRKHCYQKTPIFNFIRNRLFPKFSGYLNLSFNDIRRLSEYVVGIIERFDGKLSYRAFEKVMEDYRLRCPVNSMLHIYLVKFYKKPCTNHVYRLPFVSAYYRLYLYARRVYENSRLYGIKIKDYVLLVYNFYKNFAHEKLRKFYRFQQSLNGHVKQLIWFDRERAKDFFSFAVGAPVSLTEQQYKYLCESYGYSLELNQTPPAFDSLPDVQSVKSRLRVFREHNKNNRRKYEYLRQHPEYSFIVRMDDQWF